MPIMLVVTIVAARWVVLRLAVPVTISAQLEMGCTALWFCDEFFRARRGLPEFARNN